MSSQQLEGCRAAGGRWQQHHHLQTPMLVAQQPLQQRVAGVAPRGVAVAPALAARPQQAWAGHSRSLVAPPRAGPGGAATESKWWEKETPNMRNINGVQELVDALADAGDALVIVDFYGHWCGACRALYPKLLKLMDAFPDVVFLKVNFDENKAMCKTLGVKVLPYFHIYHGAEGRVSAFSCTVTKFQRMRDALEDFYTPICSLEENPLLPEFPDIIPHPNELTRLSLVDANGHGPNPALGSADLLCDTAAGTVVAAAAPPEPAGVA